MEAEIAQASRGRAIVGAAAASRVSGPAIVLAAAPWCGHCRRFAPVFAAAAAALPPTSRVSMVAFDADSQDGRAVLQVRGWPLTAYPTLFFLDARGSPATSHTGAMSVEELLGHAARLSASVYPGGLVGGWAAAPPPPQARTFHVVRRHREPAAAAAAKGSPTRAAAPSPRRRLVRMPMNLMRLRGGASPQRAHSPPSRRVRWADESA